MRFRNKGRSRQDGLCFRRNIRRNKPMYFDSDTEQEYRYWWHGKKPSPSRPPPLLLSSPWWRDWQVHHQNSPRLQTTIRNHKNSYTVGALRTQQQWCSMWWSILPHVWTILPYGDPNKTQDSRFSCAQRCCVLWLGRTRFHRCMIPFFVTWKVAGLWLTQPPWWFS